MAEHKVKHFIILSFFCMFAHIQQYVGKVPFNWGVLPVDPKSGFYIAVHSVHLGPHVSWNGILVFISGRRALLYFFV